MFICVTIWILDTINILHIPKFYYILVTYKMAITYQNN